MTSSTLARISESMMWPSTSTSSLTTGRAPRHRLRDLVGPDRRPQLPAAVLRVVEVPYDDLDHAGGGNGEQRAEDAEQLDPGEDADEHRQRVHVDRLRHDGDLEDVVLELLVRDEEDHRGDPGCDGLEEG